MIRFPFLPLAVVLAVAGCSGNPLGNEIDDGSVSETPVNPLPGTERPSSARSIQRYEAEDDTGNGFAKAVVYNPGVAGNPNDDTFSVDNLAFDGDNRYTRTAGASVRDLGSYMVFEGPATAPDQFGGAAITQFQHRAIHGESASGLSRFSVVRTGAYAGYGFGGFVYERNGGVVLPSTLQAAYRGDYAAIRDFNGAGGLEYVTGQMTVDIDFDDFNDGNGIKGEVFNRRILDINGVDITPSVLTALSVDADAIITELPSIVFTVGPGVIDASGEISGAVTVPYTNGDGAIEQYAEGNYYGVLSGPEGKELTGIIVIEGDDFRRDGVKVRETGGFILVGNTTP
jgi:hypothetical protein